MGEGSPFKRPHFGRHVGIKFESAANGRSRFHLDLQDFHMNPNRVVHGGVAYTLVDQAMGSALYDTLASGERGTTIEIKINYLRPVAEGRIVCDGWLVQREGDVATLEAEVLSGEKLVAKALGTYMVLTHKPANGD
jgi:acyl-CoA thioesterase